MTMGKSLRGPALNQAIRTYIKQYILDHGLRPGSSLPPEGQLAEELGVGRSSIREAIRALQTLGIVEVRHGDGLYVREYNLDPVLENMSYGIRFDGNSLLELLQVRVWLETAVMEDAVGKVTGGDLADMAAVLDTWEAAIQSGNTDAKHLNSLDRQFHQVVYNALDNRMLSKLLEVFSIAFAEFAGPFINAPRTALEDHEVMLEAIRSHDLPTVRQAIVKNLQLSGRQIRSAMTFTAWDEAHSPVSARPFKRPALSQAICDYVKQYILDSGLEAGDPLPPEAQIAQDLGVGRSSVREAIKALESLGIVQVRHGDGLYVREYNFDPVLDTLSYGMRFDARTLLELLQIRIWLETAIVKDVIQQIGSNGIARMDQVIRQWDEAIRAGVRDVAFHTEQDMQFHRALYATLGNETLVRFLEVFWIALAEFVGTYRNEPEVDLADHVAILEAVRARDADLVRSALVHNLRRNEQQIRLAIEST